MSAETSARAKIGQHHKDVHKPFPLSLSLVFAKPAHHKSGALPLPFVVKFFYLPAFDIVTTQCEAGDKDHSDVLKDLFPNDTGMHCPNPAGLLFPSGDEFVLLTVLSKIRSNFSSLLEMCLNSIQLRRARRTAGLSGSLDIGISTKSKTTKPRLLSAKLT